MRMSREADELARMNFGQRADEIASRYAEKTRQLSYGPRSGATRAAIDKAHIQKLEELADAWIETRLEAFAQEGLIPDAQDISDIGHELDQIVGGGYGNELYAPRPSSVEEIRSVPMRARKKLRIRVKEMELDSRRQQPAPPPSSVYNTTNIHGDNYGAIQQGGEGNTQNVTYSDKSSTKNNDETQ